eukprot:8037949-Pyramimonas_sp.AAC.1
MGATTGGRNRIPQTVLARPHFPDSACNSASQHFGLTLQAMLALRPHSPRSACNSASLPNQCVHVGLIPENLHQP